MYVLNTFRHRDALLSIHAVNVFPHAAYACLRQLLICVLAGYGARLHVVRDISRERKKGRKKVAETYISRNCLAWTNISTPVRILAMCGHVGYRNSTSRSCSLTIRPVHGAGVLSISIASVFCTRERIKTRSISTINGSRLINPSSCTNTRSMHAYNQTMCGVRVAGISSSTIPGCLAGLFGGVTKNLLLLFFVCTERIMSSDTNPTTCHVEWVFGFI